MTKGSRTRRAKAREKKRIAKGLSTVSGASSKASVAELPMLNQNDKRYLVVFTVLSLIITLLYWWMGGRNLFVFPALLCISVGVRKYWAGPVRRFAGDA